MSKQKSWTDYELGFLQDNDHWPAWKLADALNRTEQSVMNKRSKLRNGVPVKMEKRPSWTKAEDDFILANPRMRATDIASHLDRTKSSVDHRRDALKKSGMVDGSFRGNWSASRIGMRPLLAKTCPDCGLLLQAQWFRLNAKAGTWTRTCGRCRDRSKEKQNNTARARKQRQVFIEKYQSLTVPGATQAGQPWVEAEFETLSDPDMTILQKALALHRTYKATLVACSRGGYRSKVGLGDPERDVWIIDNPNAKEFAA